MCQPALPHTNEKPTRVAQTHTPWRPCCSKRSTSMAGSLDQGLSPDCTKKHAQAHPQTRRGSHAITAPTCTARAPGARAPPPPLPPALPRPQGLQPRTAGRAWGGTHTCGSTRQARAPPRGCLAPAQSRRALWPPPRPRLHVRACVHPGVNKQALVGGHGRGQDSHMRAIRCGAARASHCLSAQVV